MFNAMKAFKLIFTELILFMIKEYSFENALFIYNKLLEMGESNIEYLCSLNKSDIYFYFMGGVSSISAKLEFLSLSKEEVIDHFVETKENIVFVYFTEVETNSCAVESIWDSVIFACPDDRKSGSRLVWSNQRNHFNHFMSLSSYDISLEITMRLLTDLKQISNR